MQQSNTAGSTRSLINKTASTDCYLMHTREPRVRARTCVLFTSRVSGTAQYHARARENRSRQRRDAGARETDARRRRKAAGRSTRASDLYC